MRIAASVLLAGVLGGCGSPVDALSTYTIVISSTASLTAKTAQDGQVAGTYQFFRGDERITRDLTGTGTRSINVDAQSLNYVRVHGSSNDELYRVTIREDGRLIYDSASVRGRQPIFYLPQEDITPSS
ncbi:MAG: hypothetical protein AB8G17_12220 [Gammaproteobacteria bacterium]